MVLTRRFQPQLKAGLSSPVELQISCSVAFTTGSPTLTNRRDDQRLVTYSVTFSNSKQYREFCVWHSSIEQRLCEYFNEAVSCNSLLIKLFLNISFWIKWKYKATYNIRHHMQCDSTSPSVKYFAQLMKLRWDGTWF